MVCKCVEGEDGKKVFGENARMEGLEKMQKEAYESVGGRS